MDTKNKHLLLSFDTNPRFHGGCFGVWGHTSWKALNISHPAPSNSGFYAGSGQSGTVAHIIARFTFGVPRSIGHHRDVWFTLFTILYAFRLLFWFRMG
jgi:hypothetical protein